MSHVHPYQGNPAAELEALEHNRVVDSWATEFTWQCTVRAADLVASSATSFWDVTIPAAGFVSGSLTLTFTGWGLGAPVNVVAYAAAGEANTDLATALEAAVAVARGTTLAGVVADETVSTNVVTIDMVEGLTGTITRTWRSAQYFELTMTGDTALVDGDFTVTIDGGGLGAPVDVTTTRAAGTPATIADMVVQVEADLEAEAGLSGVLVSADDFDSESNALQFEPDIADVTVALAVDPQSIALRFAGTPTDGNYVTTFTHSSLPGGTAAVTTTRAGGVPATNADLGVQHEADIEGDPRLPGLIASADDNGAGTCVVIGQPGVTGLTASVSAPSPGVLTQTPLAWTANDATPTGPAVTITATYAVDLNALQPNDQFLEEATRGDVVLNVKEAFPAGTTASLDNAGAASTDVLTDVALSSTGLYSDTGTSRGDYPCTEAAWSPRLAVTMAAGAGAPTTGEVVVNVIFAPLPE